MVPELLAERGVAGPDVGRLLREGWLLTEHGRVEVAEVSRPRTGQRFAFVMDTAVCNGARWLAQRADLLVCEATYATADGELAEAYGHLTARDAGRIAAGGHARRLVLTHFSQRYADLTPLLQEARAEHDDVVLARDLERIPVPPGRRGRAPMSSPATRTVYPTTARTGRPVPKETCCDRRRPRSAGSTVLDRPQHLRPRPRRAVLRRALRLDRGGRR